jgi:hypothetical protein
MKIRLAVALLSAAVAAQAVYPLEAAATAVNVDEIAVVKNGTTILDDSFDRNITLSGGSGKIVPSGTTFTDDGTPVCALAVVGAGFVAISISTYGADLGTRHSTALAVPRGKASTRRRGESARAAGHAQRTAMQPPRRRQEQ